jgi:hypothetical protein
LRDEPPPVGFTESGSIESAGPGVARQALECETGKPVVTADRAKDFRRLVTDIIEAASLPEAGKDGGGVYH